MSMYSKGMFESFIDVRICFAIVHVFVWMNKDV